MNNATEEETKKESEWKNALTEEFTRIYEWLGYRRGSLLAYVTKQNINYTGPRWENEFISWKHTDINLICLDLKGLIKTAVELYPQLRLDENFEIVRDGLENYKKKVFIRWWRADRKVLNKVYESLDPVMSKLYLVKGSLEEMAEKLFVLESQDPKTILAPLMAGPLKAFKKDTNPIRTFVSQMKEHVADKDTWKHYRNTWKQLNQQLKIFGILEYYDASEKAMLNMNSRYPTSEKLNVIDVGICNEIMNELIDMLDVYESMMK